MVPSGPAHPDEPSRKLELDEVEWFIKPSHVIGSVEAPTHHPRSRDRVVRRVETADGE